MNLQKWMERQMVSAAAYDAEALLEGFLSEMRKGLDGGDSSLEMIPSYVGTGGQVPASRPVAVIDAGGTNLRIGIARFDESGVPVFSDFIRQPMPGRDREVSAREFYAVLAGALEPLKEHFENIGFCFSYPAEILPDLDGRLLHWTKEIKIPELVGRRIGAGLVQALEERGVSGTKVVVLNDTVAALLAGLAHGQRFGASSYIGFILGTGTNTAYVERNENIGKLGGLPPGGSQVVNVESGGFAAFDRGPFDRSLDEQSEDPGSHIFEKAISGAYLGPLALEVMQALADEEVFSPAAAVALSLMKELPTAHISNLAEGGEDTGVLESEAFSDADREVMKTVFVAVVDRAALLTAVNLAAAVVKSGEGKDPEHPVCINIDGTTYYKTHRLEERVRGYLDALLAPRGLHVRRVRVDDAPAVGAAIAGLTVFQ